MIQVIKLSKKIILEAWEAEYSNNCLNFLKKKHRVDTKGLKKQKIKGKIIQYPIWVSNPKINKKHRNILLQRNREFYLRYGW